MACVTLNAAGATVAAFSVAATSTDRTGQFIVKDEGDNNGIYQYQKNDGVNDIFALARLEPKPVGAGTTTLAWFGLRPGRF